MSSSKKLDIYVETLVEIKDNSRVLKFGVNTPLREGLPGQLVELELDQPLNDAVEKVCKVWGLHPQKFALKFNDPPFYFVTEKDRENLNGKLLMMNFSALVVSQQILEMLQKVPADVGLELLAGQISDPTLVNAFVDCNGLGKLVNLIENDKIVLDRGFLHAYNSLLHIMAHSHPEKISWSQIQPKCISSVADYVNTIQNNGLFESRLALKEALEILEKIVLVGKGHEQVVREINLRVLVNHLENEESKVQENTLLLVNALLAKAPSGPSRMRLRNALKKKYNRDIIYKYAIEETEEKRPAKINHELYVMQTLLLNIMDERKKNPVDPRDNVALNRIKELSQIALDSEIGPLFQSCSQNELATTSTDTHRKIDKVRFDYAKLGFKNGINPALDFQVPHGTLALDCMYYLAKSNAEIYIKLVLESGFRGSSGDQCHFAKSSITLVQVLCDLLRIGEPPSVQDGIFYPFFFQLAKPFKELYIICSQLVCKTWKEMRASSEESDKVFDVIRDQIRRALELDNEIPAANSFDGFQKQLYKLDYTKILNLRAQERYAMEEGILQDSYAVGHLRKVVELEMIELIKMNRMNFLIRGTTFKKYSKEGARVKGKFWFCRLSTNLKVLHYGDCYETANPLPEELPSKINVRDIVELLTGCDCPNLKDSKSKKLQKLIPMSFSLLTDAYTNMTTDFVASDDKIFDHWIDGINVLLGNPMVSTTAQKDLDILVHMEMKYKLMYLVGIELPQGPPEIPPPPPSFDYSSFLPSKA